MMEALNYMADTAEFRELHALADEFYILEKYDEASKLLEQIANKEIDSPLTRRLINSYYFGGDRGKALEVCNLLRKKYGPLKYVSEMEAAIHEEIGDLPEAKKICKDYLILFPDDFEMNLRLAILNFRTQNYEEIDIFLKLPFDINELSLHSAHLLAFLFSVRKLFKVALNIMYETRRQFYNNSDAHSKYIGFLLSNKIENDQLSNVTKVTADTAVCIETDSGTKDWYILDNRKDADMQRREINLEHALAKKLLGKDIGEEVILKESPVSVEIGKVIEIKSKYIYALHESLENIEKIFPEAQGLWKVKVDLTQKEGELPEFLKTIFGQVTIQQDKIRQLELFYKEHKITIGMFANIIGKDVIEVVGGLMHNADIGITCCIGTVDERNHALKTISQKNRLIIDIISLTTIYGLECGNIIVNQFYQIGIAQSTVDLIKTIIEEREGIHSEGLMTIGKKEGQLFKHEISAEAVKRSIEYFYQLLDWINVNCEILPVKAALTLNRNRRDKLNNLLGTSFIDSMLIANEPGNLLYSDDAHLRSLAKNEFNVEGVWTQPLLMHCLNNKILDRDKYNKFIVKLVCSNYHYISIDEHVIIEAAQQSKWTPLHPYVTVIKILSGNFSGEIPALHIATNYIYELCKQPILQTNRDNLITSLLNEITIGRNRRKIIMKLKTNLRAKLYLLPFAERDVNRLITLWENINII